MTITVHQLLTQAAMLRDHIPITIDGQPFKFASWRGDYSKLTIAPNFTGETQTAEELIRELLVIGMGNVSFTGYKGGEFLMNMNTEIYGDEYGRCDGLKIEGLMADGRIIRRSTDVII